MQVGLCAYVTYLHLTHSCIQLNCISLMVLPNGPYFNSDMWLQQCGMQYLALYNNIFSNARRFSQTCSVFLHKFGCSFGCKRTVTPQSKMLQYCRASSPQIQLCMENGVSGDSITTTLLQHYQPCSPREYNATLSQQSLVSFLTKLAT